MVRYEEQIFAIMMSTGGASVPGGSKCLTFVMRRSWSS